MFGLTPYQLRVVCRPGARIATECAAAADAVWAAVATIMQLRLSNSFTDLLLDQVALWMQAATTRRLKRRLHYCGKNVVIYLPVVFHGPEALDIGDHTSIAPFVHIWCGGRVIIGAHCMIGSHVEISSLTHDYTAEAMSATMVAKPVVIEDGVWIGAHAVILPGVKIGRGAVVGAGGVVTADVPAHTIVYGVPARVRGRRGERQPTDSLEFGLGWYPYEMQNGESFRWVDNDAEVIVLRPTGTRKAIRVELEPGPGLGGAPLCLQVLDERGRAVATAQTSGRDIIRVALPLSPSSVARFRLHVDGSGIRLPDDPRVLNFRVFALDWDS